MQLTLRLVKPAARIAALLVLILLALPLQADDDMMAEDLFISIRQYSDIDPMNMDEIMQEAGDGFLPIISASEGFIAYFLISNEDQLTAINLFTTEAAADASNEAAADFVAENLADLFAGPPEITAGTADVFYMTALEMMMAEHMGEDSEDADDEMEDETDDKMMDAGMDALYASLRIYSGFDMMNQAELMDQAQNGFLPIQQESDGFFGYIGMTDGMNAAAFLSLYDSEEAAEEVALLAADFVAENLAALLPDDPTILTGNVGVAALAGVHMGENLIGAMMNE